MTPNTTDWRRRRDTAPSESESRTDGLVFQAFCRDDAEVSNAVTQTLPISERCGKAGSLPQRRHVAAQGNYIGRFAGLFYGRYWARTSDPQLVELVLSQLS